MGDGVPSMGFHSRLVEDVDVGAALRCSDLTVAPQWAPLRADRAPVRGRWGRGGGKHIKNLSFWIEFGAPGFPRGPGCGYNSCSYNLRLSEVRSGSIRLDLESVWGPLAPKPVPN